MQADLFGAQVITYDPQAVRAFQADLARALSRRTDPATSHAAADSAKQFQAAHQHAIIDCLAAHGPLGKTGISQRTGIDHVAVCRRLSELQRYGAARPTGRTVQSASGRAEREWEAVDA